MTADTLYPLLAPVALFPDALLAQVLAASTVPDEVNAANAWVRRHPKMAPADRTGAVAALPWSAAVKGLTAFPDVLAQMAQNLPWTRALGDAYTRSPTDVMNAVQVLRQRATQSGALKNSAQQRVVVTPAADQTTPDATVPSPVVKTPPQTVIIQPSQPNVVYVPTYGPGVYGNPPVVYYPGYVPPPAYSTGDMVATGLISFTAGVMVGTLTNDNWGWNNWVMHWGGHPVVIYNNHTFIDRRSVRIENNRLAPGPVRAPHFSSTRNAFGPLQAANGGRPMPTFDPHRNAAQYMPYPHNAPGPVIATTGTRLRTGETVASSHAAQSPIRRSSERSPHFIQPRQTDVFPRSSSLRADGADRTFSMPEGITAERRLDAITHRHRF